MSVFEPLVAAPQAGLGPMPAGAPVACVGRIGERSRFEWRLEDQVDPGVALEAYLTSEGFAVADLGRPSDRRSHEDNGVCGAAIFISAAGAARLAGVLLKSDTSGSTVPDLVAVTYSHSVTGGARPSRPGGGSDGGGSDGGEWEVGGWLESWSADRHTAAVEAVREAIARGDVYQVNLVGHARAPYAGDPRPALHRVATLPGARYGGMLTGDGWAIASASPETLVAVDGGRAITRPIKGTRPATPDGRLQLLASAKERAEHIMIVDLERNDLAVVARTGSVRVDELYAVRRWCGLWQAESTVSARLADGVGLAALLRAICPGGSVIGAPKRAALDVITGLEPVGRGPSMGAFGWLGHGSLDLGLTIRTVAADDTDLHVWAGGGITWGSDPAAEVAEAAAKAAPIRAALEGRR